MICKKWCNSVKLEHEQVKKLLESCDKYHKRVIELEDTIEKEYGIKVRNEITEIKIMFDKLELSVLYAALCKLMTQPANTEDTQYYLNLRLKIEETLNQMKE